MKKAFFIALVLLSLFSQTSKAQWQPRALPFVGVSVSGHERTNALAMVPQLHIDAPSDPANVQLGRSLTLRFGIQNMSLDTLRITRIEATSTEAHLSTPTLTAIGSRSESFFDVTTTPTHAGIDSGSIIIHSNSAPTGLDTITYHILIGSERVRTSWSKSIISPNDTTDAFAETVAIAGHTQLLAGLLAADSTPVQNLMLESFDTSGAYQWKHRSGLGSLLSQQILLAPPTIYYSGTLWGGVGVLSAFDMNGTLIWADSMGLGQGADCFGSVLTTTENIFSISHGYAYGSDGRIVSFREEGEVGILRTDASNSNPNQQLLNGTSHVERNNSTVFTRNLDDYPLGVAADRVGGIYLLNDMDITISVSSGTTYTDVREYRLFHIDSKNSAPDWSLVVEGNTLGVDDLGNALIGGLSLTKVDVRGHQLSKAPLLGGDAWIRTSNGGFNTYSEPNATSRYAEGRGLLWTGPCNPELDLPRTYGYLATRPAKLLSDAQSNVYVVITASTGSGSEISVTKFDSLGTLRWTITHEGAFRDTAIDAVLDPQGPIYVCGGTADAGGKYRPLIWKIDQDPISGAVAQAEKPVTEISAYPNPFTREVSATVPNLVGATYDYALTDVLGRTVARGANLHARTIKLNGELLVEGVYLLRITDGAGNVVEGKLMHQSR
jgi:hypothetical protein